MTKRLEQNPSKYQCLSLHDPYRKRLNEAYGPIVKEAKRLQFEGKITRFFLDRQYFSNYDNENHLTLGFLPISNVGRETLEVFFKGMVEKQNYASYGFQASGEQQEVDDVKALAMECFLIDKDAVGFSCKLAILHHHYLNYGDYYGDRVPTIESVKQEIESLRGIRTKIDQGKLADEIQGLYADEMCFMWKGLSKLRIQGKHT